MKHLLFVLLGALCNTPLGLQNGRLPNSRITSSSEYNVYHAARLGRLGLHKRGRYVGAWCARHNNRNQWIKVDFGGTMKITKIATQGRQDAAQWVTYYRVSSSLDGVHWQVYRFKNNDKVRKYIVVENAYSCELSGVSNIQLHWNPEFFSSYQKISKIEKSRHQVSTVL